jgi:hypothetical protein
MKEIKGVLGTVAHACNLSNWEVRQEDLEFEASLDYMERPCLEKNKPKKVNSKIEEMFVKCSYMIIILNTHKSARKL